MSKKKDAGADAPADNAAENSEATATDATTDVAVKSETDVQAAGVFDNIALLLPFVFDPSKISAVVDGIRWMREEESFTGKWNGFKKIGDVAFPLFDEFAKYRNPVGASGASYSPNELPAGDVKMLCVKAVEVSQLQTYVEVQSFVEAKRLGDGQLLERLKDGVEWMKTSPLGQMMLQLLLAKLTGGLLAPK